LTLTPSRATLHVDGNSAGSHATPVRVILVRSKAMKKISKLPATLASLLIAGIVCAPAHAGADIGPAAVGTVYRLNDAATYTEGCFDLCLCPIFLQENFRGTFRLTPLVSTGTVIDYRVDDVEWYVGNSTRITGSGTYQRISGVAGWLHRMQLDLSINGGPAQSFDSGLQNGGGEFPDIMIGLSTGSQCYDIRPVIDASPVPPYQIIRERLIRGSTYQEGCLPPCLCPILVAQPLRGTFSLVKIAGDGHTTEYAVLDVRLNVISIYPVPSSSFRGSGKYTRIAGFAGFLHQLELDLSVDGEIPVSFDSGLVNERRPFPAIDIAVAQNDFFCYDIVLDIKARPGPTLTPVPWAVTADK